MIKEFENSYWQENKQKLAFRHISTMKLMKKYGASDFLDIWCWDGFFLNYIQENIGINWIGFELSDVWYESSKKQWLKVFQVDILNKESTQNFIDNSFWFITCLDVLEHLFNPEVAIKNIHELTDAYFIFSVPNFNSITARIQVLFWKTPENNTPKKWHCYWFNLENIHKLMNENSFEIIEIESNTISIFEKLWIGRLLKKIFPSLFSLSFTVICKKL